MKILFFTNNLLGRDGWSRYSLNIISTLQKIGVGVVCLVNKKDDLINLRQHEILGKPLKYFNNPFNIILDFLKIRRVINNENPDIVHFLVEPYALLLPLIYNKRIKYFLSICGSYTLLPLKRIRTRVLAKFYYKKAGKIISISNYTKNRLLEILPYLREKILIINCGIDLSDAELHFPSNAKKNILFVGAIKERKGLLEALMAFKIYKEKFGNSFIFNIVGDYNEKDDYYITLKKFIFNNGLQGEIEFRGDVNEQDKVNYFKKADLFLMLSRVCGDYFEGFGLVYLEANKYGIPVIGPNDGGPTDAIKDGFSGYLVDVFNAKEVAEKINLVLNERKIKRENCLTWARNFDISQKAAEIIALYYECS